jgi:CDP-diglyceride synthetase
VALFLVLVGVIFYVYAQMHKDSTLSHVTNTTPGELGMEFWVKILSFGIAPLLGLLTTIFPDIGDFVFSWLQPGLQSLK